MFSMLGFVDVGSRLVSYVEYVDVLFFNFYMFDVENVNELSDINIFS